MQTETGIIVKKILENYPDSRVSKARLVSLFWENERKCRFIPPYDILKAVYQDKLTCPIEISNAMDYMQKQHPELNPTETQRIKYSLMLIELNKKRDPLNYILKEEKPEIQTRLL